MKIVDMSEKAILKRFNQLEQLREVSLFLIKAKKAQDENLRKDSNTKNSLKMEIKNTDAAKS